MLTVENESLFDELQSVCKGWRVIFRFCNLFSYFCKFQAKRFTLEMGVCGWVRMARLCPAELVERMVVNMMMMMVVIMMMVVMVMMVIMVMMMTTTRMMVFTCSKGCSRSPDRRCSNCRELLGHQLDHHCCRYCSPVDHILNFS